MRSISGGAHCLILPQGKGPSTQRCVPIEKPEPKNASKLHCFFVRFMAGVGGRGCEMLCVPSIFVKCTDLIFFMPKGPSLFSN